MPSEFDAGRRRFLQAIPAAAAAAAVMTACRPAPYNAGDFHVAPRSAVGLFAARDYGADLVDLVSRGVAMLAPPVAARRVLLKPNMVEYIPGHPITTHPAVVAAAAIAFLRAGAREVTVGEGPGHQRDTEYLLIATGLHDHLRDLRLRFVDLNHDDVREVPLRSHFTGLPRLFLPEALLQADVVVSLPKLKTHHWAGMTAGMKNLFGTVPGAVYGWPKNPLHFRGIDNAIVDLTATIRPAFTIVDAIVAMEGDGPIMGRPRASGFLAMGRDPVAVDATCARAMGLDPARLPYLADASRFLGNLADDRIVHRGEPLARFAARFDLVDTLRHLRADS